MKKLSFLKIIFTLVFFLSPFFVSATDSPYLWLWASPSCSAGEVLLYWPSMAGATGYNLYRSIEYIDPEGNWTPVLDNEGNWNPVVVVANSSAVSILGSVSYTDTGLSPGLYLYAVSAIYSSGESAKVLSVTFPGWNCHYDSSHLPTVATGPVTDITQTTAKGSFSILSVGGEGFPGNKLHIASAGLVWNRADSPTLPTFLPWNPPESLQTTMPYNHPYYPGIEINWDALIGSPQTRNMYGPTPGSSDKPFLSPNTTYHVRAYAHNGSSDGTIRYTMFDEGIAYGDVVTFRTLCPIGQTRDPVTGICAVTFSDRPVVSIIASPTSGAVNVVNPTITWSATNNPTSCTATGDWKTTPPLATALDQTQSQGILGTPKTYTYALTCTNAAGPGSPSSATVSVTSAVPVVSIIASPTSGAVGVVNPTIYWSATNNPISCTATGDWKTTPPLATDHFQNQFQGVLDTPKTYTYALTCTNAAGPSLLKSATVDVGSACPTPPVNASACSSQGSGPIRMYNNNLCPQSPASDICQYQCSTGYYVKNNICVKSTIYQP